MRLRTVDAFTERPFSGNPARASDPGGGTAVIVLDETPGDEWMAALAREMNLSETAFVIRERLPDADFRLRWFTPTLEIDLCGHATLAAAHCLLDDGVSGPIRFAEVPAAVRTASERVARPCRDVQPSPDRTRCRGVARLQCLIVTA